MQAKVVYHGLGRHTDDIRGAAEADGEVEKALLTRFANRRYEISDGTIDVAVNWKPYFGKHRRHVRSAILAADVRGARGEDAADALQVYLLEVFLLCNLCSPGFFSHFQLDLSVNRALPRRFALDGYVFDAAWHTAAEGRPPTVSSLSIDDVCAWYERLNIGAKQLATTRTEKAIFSLLHSCQLAFSLDPLEVMWLAQALENLYQVPPALSFSFLASRVIAIFGLTGADATRIKRELRTFYDARNAFVHGGAAIIHPVGSGGLDPACEEHRERYMDPSLFASQLVLATLQELVRRRWTSLSFTEAVADESITSSSCPA